MKKGNSTWKPANVLDVFDKDPGYRYRIAEKSAKNIAKKQREGWEIVSDTTDPNTKLSQGNYLDKGKPLTSVLEGYDYVVMRTPEDNAKLRDAYINSENERRTSALRRVTQKELGGAPVHGSITMEKKGLRNIIKE